MAGDVDELLAIQRAYGIVRSFTFCLDEPDRHPAFTAANDRTLSHAAAAPGELIPFVRLDLDETPIDEARRCLDRGARGIKLHPRAQRFLPDDPRLEPVFALAAEHRVPVLIHGGRGLPPIADSLARLLDRHCPPALIVAHAGIVDLAAMARNFAGRPDVQNKIRVIWPRPISNLKNDRNTDQKCSQNLQRTAQIIHIFPPKKNLL